MISPSYIVPDILHRSTVGLELDLQVKSEPESNDEEEERIDAEVVSPASQEHSINSGRNQSCDEDDDFVDEPLVDIESITVPQQLVAVDLKPTLLLFVNSNNSQSKCTQTDSILKDEDVEKRKSITKALRSIKRKVNSCGTSKSSNLSLYHQSVGNKSTGTVDKLTFNSEESKNSPENSDHCSSNNEPPPPPSSSSDTDVESNRKSNLSVLKLKSKTKRRKVHCVKQKRYCDRVKRSNNTKSKNNKHFTTLKTNEEPMTQSSNEKVEELSNSCNLKEHQFEKPSAEEITSTNVNSRKNKKPLQSKQKINSCEKLEKSTKPESFDCTVCGKKYKKKSHLATHARAHIDIRNFKCAECGKMFKTKTNLFYHMKTHEEAPFICEKCNKEFPERKGLVRHIRVVHSGEGHYNCDQCGRSFKSRQNLELHYTLHSGNKPFSCHVCAKSFVYKSTYVAHVRAHEADEQFSCEVCISDQANKGEMRRRCHHFSEARPWLCTVCGKGYPLKATLKNHMRTHEPDKRFTCKDCGKSFMKKSSYDSHIKLHSGEVPPFMCDQCSQSYFTVFALKRHYMKHTGERKFVCDICSKAFWMKDALKVHKRSHSNLKMFQCPQCAKAFAHKHTLIAHMRSHSAEQSFACSTCQKTFTHRHNLERHERQHVTELPPVPSLHPLLPAAVMPPPHPTHSQHYPHAQHYPPPQHQQSLMSLPPSMLMMPPTTHFDLHVL